MLETREEGDEAFRNVGGSMVVGVEVGVGTVSARRPMKVTLTNRMMHADQMVGQASAPNSYSLFPYTFTSLHNPLHFSYASIKMLRPWR
jgi:hypothetical protein